MRHGLIFWVTTVLVGTAASAAREETTLSYPDLLSCLTDLDRLPVIEPGVTCKQFSSYDRKSQIDEASGKYIHWEANGDAGQYLRIDPDTKEGVMAEMDGPGCIFRIWSANPQGKIRFYLDSDTKPTYEWDFAALFRGKIDPFIPPLVWCRDPRNFESAADCYLPIPYAKSCKITGLMIDKKGNPKPPGQYYHIDYRTYPKDWRIETFKLPLSETDHAAVEKTARQWSGTGARAIRGPTLSSKDGAPANPITIPPGETQVIFEANQPGRILHLAAKLKSQEKWVSRKVLLRAYWDGEQKPSIDCPLGDFFGEPKDVQYQSYPMQITSAINSCYFCMPFHKSARIEVVNQGSEPAELTHSVIALGGTVPQNWALFHAKYRQEKASTTFDYPFLEAKGTGKFVGVCLFPDNLHGGWWGEGDEKVWVDGEKFPSWFGTGSEDYFGDAWGIQYFVNPSHGHPQRRVERLQGCYRWHIADNIPFYKSFRMTIENYAGLPHEKIKNDYYSVAYWYQLPGGSDFFTDVPVADRIPRGFTVPEALEAEDCVVPDQKSASVVNDERLPLPLSQGKGVRLAGKAGDTFTFRLPVESADRYRITADIPRGVKGCEFEILADGHKIEKWAQLKKGDNTVTIRLLGAAANAGSCETIIDYFRLNVYENLIADWLFIGPFANPDGKGLDVAYPPEKGVDVKASYDGRDGKTGWQKFSNPTGRIMVDTLLEPKENCVVYGACIVDAPQAGPYQLLVGSDDGVKVWVNGKEVWRNQIERSMQVDADKIDVSLNKGPNLLLIKVQQQQGGVGWVARFRDPHDTLKYSLPK